MKYSLEENVHELVLSFPPRIKSPSSSDRSQGSPVQPSQKSVEKKLSGTLVVPLKMPSKNPSDRSGFSGSLLKKSKSTSPRGRKKPSQYVQLEEQSLDISQIHTPYAVNDGNYGDVSLLDLIDQLEP